MEWIIDFFKNSYEWMLSGIIPALLSLIVTIVLGTSAVKVVKKKKGNNVQKQKLNIGNDSTAVQVNGNVTITNDYMQIKSIFDKFYKKIADGKIPTNIAQANYIPKKCDVELAKKIQEVFNEPKLQYYLKDFDLGNDFDKEVFYPLNELEYQFKMTDYEFVDDKVEKCKKQLENDISKFTSFKAANTFGKRGNDQGLSESIDWNLKRKMTYEFNELATNVWESYSNLVKITRERF